MAKINVFLENILLRCEPLLGKYFALKNDENKKNLYARQCLLGKESMLMPECEINNFLGERERIRIGDHSYIRGRLLTYGHGGKISIGNWCYVGLRTEIWSMESINIGDRVLTRQRRKFSTSNKGGPDDQKMVCFLLIKSKKVDESRQKSGPKSQMGYFFLENTVS